MKVIIRMGLPIALSLMLSSCETVYSRGELEFPMEALKNPDIGEEFKIVQVSDEREFHKEPSNAYTPSLRDDAIDDESITSRAIARRIDPTTGLWGDSVGDFLLPAGQTVSMLVKNSLINAFRENGFRVVNESDSGYQDAIPLEIGVEEFWGWIDVLPFASRFNFRALIHVSGPIAQFIQGLSFDTHVARKGVSWGANSHRENWRVVIRMALSEINDDILDAIQVRDSSSSSVGASAESRLRRLGRLRDEGLISDEEYQSLRNQILKEL